MYHYLESNVAYNDNEDVNFIDIFEYSNELST